MSARARANPGSYRRWKPIWKGRRAASTAASAARVSATSRATGFSEKIALPARAADEICRACSGVGEAMSTAPIRPSAKTRSRSSVA